MLLKICVNSTELNEEISRINEEKRVEIEEIEASIKGMRNYIYELENGEHKEWSSIISMVSKLKKDVETAEVKLSTIDNKFSKQIANCIRLSSIEDRMDKNVDKALRFIKYRR